MTKNRYIHTAQYYDGGNQRPFTKDITFYKHYIQAGYHILDIGCGTGRVAIELVQHNVQVMGIDISQTMLAIFREKLSLLSPELTQNISFIQADMTHFNLNKSFDLIIFPFRVFQALITNEQRVKCLAAIKAHLKPNGKAIINMFNPNFELLKNFEQVNTVDYEYFDTTLNQNIRRRTIGEYVDFKQQILHSKYVFEIGDMEGTTTQIIEEPLELGYLTKEQLDTLFTQNNLVVEDVYSWWDFSPYHPNEQKELIYILKTKS